MKFHILFISILIIYSVKSEESPYYIGADVGYGFVRYNANFSNFEGIDKCGIYDKGTGTSLKGRLFAEYRLIDFFSIGLNLGYQTKNAIMNKANTAYARNLKDDKVVLVKTNNQLDMNFNSLDFGIDFNFLLIKDFFNGPLYLNINPNIQFQTSGDFIQKEFIDNPNGAAFKIGDKIFFEKLNAQGKFTTLKNSVLNISTGLYNSTEIAHNLYLTQRIGVAKDFGNLLTDAEITSMSIYASLGIKIAFDEPKEVIAPQPPMKPLQPLPIEPKPLPIVDLKSDFDYGNSYIEKGEKLIATTPIVLAVFFDFNKSNLKSEYTSQKSNLEDPIRDHYNIFKNLKQILDKNPESKLKLWGSTSGKDENNSLELAKKRVETVKNEFIKLGVPITKLITTYTINPQILTNVDYKEGLEENRRVTIDLLNANSVEFVKKTEYERLFGEVNFELSRKNIREEAIFGSSILENNETANWGKFKKNFKKDLVRDKELEIASFVKVNEMINDEDTIEVDLNKITKRDVDLKTDEFEAVLMFDFSSSVLTQETKTLLNQLVELLPEGKTIQMIGNSDNIGLEQYNKQIANDRADNAIEFIKENTNKNFYFEKLTNTQKFDENTPQGRYLNRSIIIKIK